MIDLGYILIITSFFLLPSPRTISEDQLLLTIYGNNELSFALILGIFGFASGTLATFGMWQLGSRSMFLALFDAFFLFPLLFRLLSSSQVPALLLATCSVGHDYYLKENNGLKTNLT